jgi:ABC-type uncharacterized transport system fused permease/ATPase subunit
MYVVGGRDEKNCALQTVECFDGLTHTCVFLSFYFVCLWRLLLVPSLHLYESMYTHTHTHTHTYMHACIRMYIYMHACIRIMCVCVCVCVLSLCKLHQQMHQQCIS